MSPERTKRPLWGTSLTAVSHHSVVFLSHGTFGATTPLQTMEWLNPFGSLWTTKVHNRCKFHGTYFSADCEAVYQTDKVGVHVKPPVERFPSTAEGIYRLLNSLREFSKLLDAVEDDKDIFGVHQALGLLDGRQFADDISVYDCDEWISEAEKYIDDLGEVMDILCLDLLRAWHSQSGAREAIEMWCVVNNTTMDHLIRNFSDGESVADEVSWYAETEGWVAV